MFHSVILVPYPCKTVSFKYHGTIEYGGKIAICRDAIREMSIRHWWMSIRHSNCRFVIQNVDSAFRMLVLEIRGMGIENTEPALWTPIRHCEGQLDKTNAYSILWLSIRNLPMPNRHSSLSSRIDNVIDWKGASWAGFAGVWALWSIFFGEMRGGNKYKNMY